MSVTVSKPYWFIIAIPVLSLAVFRDSHRVMAAPAIIIVHGERLAQRVVMSDWQENLRFMTAIGVSTRSDSSAVATRPYVDLAMYWGPEWANYPRTPAALEQLRTEQANQHGRFYPAQDQSPALVLIGPGFGRAYTTLGRVSEQGLAVLAQYQVPVRLDGRCGPA